MMRARVMRQVGGSVMIALPPQMLRHLGGAAGDVVNLITVDGGLLVTRYTPAMEVAHNVMERSHRRLAQGLRRLTTPSWER